MRDFCSAVRADGGEEGSVVTSSGLGVEEDWVLKRLADGVVGWKISSRVLFLTAALEPIAALLGLATAKEWRLALVM